MNYNRLIFGGRLTRDPELRYTPKGVAIARLGLCSNRKRGDTEEATFLDATAFDKTAETIAKHFKKGEPILIEGRLKTESWADKKSGEKRSRLVAIAESFQFVGGGKGKPAEAPAPETPPGDAPAADPQGGDDVPF